MRRRRPRNQDLDTLLTLAKLDPNPFWGKAIPDLVEELRDLRKIVGPKWAKRIGEPWFEEKCR